MSQITKVWVLHSGCIYEGGGLDGLFFIHTGRCKHCGKKKEHHFFTLIPNQSGFCDHASRRGDLPRMYQDSGLAALDAHKEELYEVANDICDEYHYTGRIDIATELRLQSILNQIEKEK